MEQEQDRVVAILRESQGAVPTLEIARRVLGARATCRDINPTLYAMQQKGLVERRSSRPNGAKPCWALREKEQGGKGGEIQGERIVYCAP